MTTKNATATAAAKCNRNGSGKMQPQRAKCDGNGKLLG